MKGKNQLLTGFTGSLENMTAVRAKDGDTILKGKIVTMTNPNTAAQQNQRGLFGGVVALASLIITFIRANFASPKPMVSSYNQFVKQAVNNGNNENKFEVKFAMPYFEFTNGDLYPLSPAEPTGGWGSSTGGTTTVDVDWLYDSNSNAQDGTDTIHALVVNDNIKDWFTLDPTATRADGTVQLSFPTPTEGIAYVTVFARSVATGEVSSNKAVVTVAADGTVAGN